MKTNVWAGFHQRPSAGRSAATGATATAQNYEPLAATFTVHLARLLTARLNLQERENSVFSAW